MFVSKAPLISQLHHIASEKERERHEKVNAMHANDHNRFWVASRRLIVNYLFDVFGVLWNIESGFEFYVICADRGYRFAVDI